MKTKIFYVLALVLVIQACSKQDSSQEFGDASYHNSKAGDYESYLGDQYNEYEENPFIQVVEKSVSTFSIDADGAAYSNTRRFLMDGANPPAAAIRTEELINYFAYSYPEPNDGHPIAINGEVSACPWEKDHKLIRIGIKGKSFDKPEIPPANLVLLIDVSGSMSSDDKLDLLKKSFQLFVHEMRPQDKMAIVTYAGQAGLKLPATSGSEKDKILEAISKLGAGGSTAGADGIHTAYKIAEENFVEGGNNRVILGTDGDLNVGPSSQEELIELIESKRSKGVFLTVLGVGRGNLNDAAMEQIADHGNGNYEYIDNIEQAKKIFVHEYGKFLQLLKM